MSEIITDELVEKAAIAALKRGNEITPFAYTWEMSDVDERKHVCNQIRAALASVAQDIAAAERTWALAVCEQWAQNGFPHARLIAKNIREVAI